MSKYRDHMCFACFKRCTDKKCDANHRCSHCGGDYIYFCDEAAKLAMQKFYKWKKAFDAKAEERQAKRVARRNAKMKKEKKQYVKPKRNTRA